MNLTENQKKYLTEKQNILDKTKNEIKAVLLTALKINDSLSNKKKINILFDKYLVK